MKLVYNGDDLEKPFDIANLAALINKLSQGNVTDSLWLKTDSETPVAKIIQSPFDSADCVVMTRKLGSQTCPFSRPHIIYNFLLGQVETSQRGNPIV